MTAPSELTAVRRRRRRKVVDDLAADQGGVVSRGQLYAAGFSRGEVRASVRAGRWRTLGRHVLVVGSERAGAEGRWWAAVLEGGPRAFLDADSALVAAGLQRFESPHVRVSVPRGARVRGRGTALNVRQTRRWRPDDVVTHSGVPRARPEVAAVRAALWARSDREAELVVTMAVQQGIARLSDIAVELLAVRRDKRRGLLQLLVLDLAGGVGSLNELDVVRGLRDRGLPAPDVQALRRTANGTYHLDFRWERWGVVLEVDGIQHAWVENLVADALRQNDIALTGDTVLRLPVMGLRACPDAFFAQVERALRDAGRPWRPGAA